MMTKRYKLPLGALSLPGMGRRVGIPRSSCILQFGCDQRAVQRQKAVHCSVMLRLVGQDIVTGVSELSTPLTVGPRNLRASASSDV